VIERSGDFVLKTDRDFNDPMTQSQNVLRLDHFTATQARGAYPHPLGGSAHAGVYWTQIHVPAPFGNVMGVADAVSRLRFLTADITFLCHDCY
jgi:hypothetical protein